MEPRLVKVDVCEFTVQELPVRVDSVAVKLTETILPILANPLLFNLVFVILKN